MNVANHPRPGRLRRRGEGGAVLVEIALILPVLMVISLAVLELGMAWKASITVASATRSGARVASHLGVNMQADQQALLAVRAALEGIPASEIERVVVFRAANADATVPPNCLSAAAKTTGGNSTSKCNVYSGADLASVGTLNFSSCNSPARHRFWCPTSRVNAQAALAGLDWIGVYVKVEKRAATRLFGATIDIDDTTIMRIEPNAGNE